jgi:phage shock protein A
MADMDAQAAEWDPPAGAVITLGEGRLALEVAAANRALRARVRKLEADLAAARAQLED